MNHKFTLLKLFRRYIVAYLMMVLMVSQCVSAHGQAPTPTPSGKLGAGIKGGGVYLVIERNYKGGWTPLKGKSKRTVWIGQKINLRAKLSDGSALSSYSWSIPGNAYRSYKPAHNPSLHPVPLGPIDEDEIVFKWRDRSSSYLTVSCIATQGAKTFRANIQFLIKKPSSILTTDTSSVTVTPTAGTAQKAGTIRFGMPGVAGIYFRATITNYPAGSQFQYCQVVNSTQRRKLYGNQWYRYDPDGIAPFHDTYAGEIFWYYPTFDGTNESNGTYYLGTSDSPSVTSTFEYGGSLYLGEEIRVTDSFTMWLMFKTSETGSEWVPLRSVDWYWSGRSTYNVATATWVGSYLDNSVSPVGAETTKFPEWDGQVWKAQWVLHP